MSEFKDLYQELILDHSKKPRNFRRLEDANRRANGFNALCGDKLTLYLKMDGDRIGDVAFEGSGCAISKASASLMTSSLKGKTKQEAQKLFESFHDLVTGQGETDSELLGKLAVFSGVCEYPARVKCASLAWRTLQAALEEQGEEPVKTE